LGLVRIFKPLLSLLNSIPVVTKKKDTGKQPRGGDMFVAGQAANDKSPVGTACLWQDFWQLAGSKSVAWRLPFPHSKTAGGFVNPPGAIYGLPGSARDARFGLTNPNHRKCGKTPPRS